MADVVSFAGAKRWRRADARRDRLVCENFHLVQPIAERIMLRLPPSFELDDLVQTGHIGLMQAATRYRPGKHNGTPFSAFARPVIRGKILDSVRRRHYIENTRPEITEPLDLPAPEIGFEVGIDRQRLLQRVALECDQLTAEQSEVVASYYSPQLPSFENVAAFLGISERRVVRAHTEALELLRRVLVVA